MLNLNTRTAQYRTGYNDAYQDATIRGHRRLRPPRACPDYWTGYDAAWRIYGS